MKEIRFNSSRYHQQGEMIDWCEHRIGEGGWYAGGEILEWRGLGKWRVSSAFGNTFFKFRDDADATLFTLRWV